jgi:hypothetical protein
MAFTVPSRRTVSIRGDRRMTDRLGAVRQSCCTGGSHVEGGNAGGSAGRIAVGPGQYATHVCVSLARSSTFRDHAATCASISSTVVTTSDLPGSTTSGVQVRRARNAGRSPSDSNHSLMTMTAAEPVRGRAIALQRAGEAHIMPRLASRMSREHHRPQPRGTPCSRSRTEGGKSIWRSADGSMPSSSRTRSRNAL